MDSGRLQYSPYEQCHRRDRPCRRNAVSAAGAPATIVQDLLPDREAEAVLSASSMELNRAVVESQAMETSILSPLVVAELRAYGQDADHRARMQCMSWAKSVVNQTRARSSAGPWSVAGRWNSTAT